jgi:hypothetical protein
LLEIAKIVAVDTNNSRHESSRLCKLVVACRWNSWRSFAMSYYQEQMRSLLSRRAGDWLLCRRWPRMFAAFALMLPLLCAYTCWNELPLVGIHNGVARVPICIIAAYAGYLCVMGLWLVRMAPMDAKSLLVNGAKDLKTPVPGDSQFDRSFDDAVDFQIEQANCRGEGFKAMFALAALGYVFIAIHFIYHAPWYLGQLMVDSGKVRHRSVKASGQVSWFSPTVRQSWVVAIALTVHYTFMAVALTTIKR